MGESVRGIIHVHSDFSRDGLCSIGDLADFARDVGLQFVGLTDHAEDFSSEDMKSLRQECKKNSDESCVVIPGLEFRCSEDIHILGLGITGDMGSTDPVVVSRQVQSLGGIAILAHPGRNDHKCPRDLYSVLNGIEIWNAGDDGQIVPPVAGLYLLQGARRSNPAISGFGGADLHSLDGHPKVVTELQAKRVSPVNSQIVLDCLRSGRFTVRGRYVAIDAHAMPNRLRCSWFWALRKFYVVATAIRDVTLGEI